MVPCLVQPTLENECHCDECHCDEYHCDDWGISLDPKLTILGAAYGPKDVTNDVSHMMNGNQLTVKVSNGVFRGDPWPGIPKSLVVIYQYGNELTRTAITQEGSIMRIKYIFLPLCTKLAALPCAC